MSKFGHQLSDYVSKEMGTWKFVGFLSTVTALWIGLNVFLPLNKRFDKYPFVALNLVYSFLAGFTAPILLMSANRQGEADRKKIIETLNLERQDSIHIHAMLHKIVSLEQDIEDAMKLRTSPVAAQPEWVCDSCGAAYGIWWEAGEYCGPSKHLATYHVDDCRVCGRHVPCTEPRDYGYLRKEWLEHAAKQ